MTLAVRCLEVLEGIAPFEERRRALLELYRQRQADPQLAAQDATAPRDDLERLWSESAGPDILAVLPELAGPDEYLGWACEGFAAAHEQLASAVPGVPPVLDTMAGLVLQAGQEHAPAGLASVAGTGGYLAVQERITAAGKFDPRAWAARTRSWLGRGLAAGQIDACRGWLDMGVRITGILHGLRTYPDWPEPCWLPVGGFQRDVRTLARPRRTANPLVTTLALRRAQVAVPGQASGTDGDEASRRWAAVRTRLNTAGNHPPGRTTRWRTWLRCPDWTR